MVVRKGAGGRKSGAGGQKRRGSNFDGDDDDDTIVHHTEQLVLMDGTPDGKAELYRPEMGTMSSALKAKVGVIHGSSLTDAQVDGLQRHYPHMEKKEIRGLMLLFQSWDVDKSGAISVDEMALMLDR